MNRRRLKDDTTTRARPRSAAPSPASSLQLQGRPPTCTAGRAAAISLAEGIKAEHADPAPGTGKRDAYLGMLASGSSDDPIALLKGAGVDMTTSAPFAAAMREMNRVMDEMEKILGRR